MNEKSTRLVLFTEEYWRVSAWYKKKSELSWVDLGDVVQVCIERKEKINIIKSIDIKQYLGNKEWTYTSLMSFMYVIRILLRCTAEFDIQPNLFRDYCSTLKCMHTCISEDASILIQMRFLKELWSLNPTFFETDALMRYIYSEIDTTPIQKLIASKPLQDKHKDIVIRSNWYAMELFS